MALTFQMHLLPYLAPIVVSQKASSESLLLASVKKSALIAFFPFDGSFENEAPVFVKEKKSPPLRFTSSAFGSPEFVLDGKKGISLHFDGSSYIEVDLDINPAVIPRVTLGGWIRPSKILDNGYSYIFTQSGEVGDRSMFIDESGFLGVKLGGDYSEKFPVRFGEWQFVAAVYDHINNNVALYIDGQFIYSDVHFENNDESLLIGGCSKPGTGYTGLLDSFFLYGDVLSRDDLDYLRLHLKINDAPIAGSAGHAVILKGSRYIEVMSNDDLRLV